jgi:hypothetical protein
LSIRNALKSILSKSKLCLGNKRSILMIKDQIRQNVVFGRLSLGEKGKNLAKSIHFVKYFKLFFFNKLEPRTEPRTRVLENLRTGTEPEPKS